MKKKERKPGEISPGKFGVYGSDGTLRGHVGPRATSSTAARFTGEAGAVLAPKDGRMAWHFPDKPDESSE
jgi:hypothetical protein